MPSDYAAITKHNEEMLGKDTASRKSQVMMYSDFTHFVYEILQNADDYGATVIEFLLAPGQLTIEHNGAPFRCKNVQAISYFENSTSREDVVKTGHFGLGFKSVFAFTATPVIFSGEENFEIYDLYRLKPAARPDNLSVERTRIQLPFNHGLVRPNFIETHVSAKDAFEKIATRLRKLEMEVLLFTRNLRCIAWQIGNDKALYTREDEEVVTYTPPLQRKNVIIRNGTESHTHLVFTRPIVWTDSTASDPKQYRPVEIAFRLGPQGIVRQPKKYLVVLFETKIETKMGFLINGPYRTTPNRETIKEEDAFNQHLMQNTARLVADSLPHLKELRLLSVALLETLPLRTDDFPADSLFRPVFDAVRESLLTIPLLPTYQENGEHDTALVAYTSGRDAKLAGSYELRKLLSSEQLVELHGGSAPLSWIDRDITADRTPELWKYLRGELGIEEIDAKSFMSRIDEPFLSRQTDEWLVSMYAFLLAQQAWLKNLKSRRESAWSKAEVPFMTKPIVRLEDGRHISPFLDDRGKDLAAFLPSTERRHLPSVKATIAEKKDALEFFKAIGFEVPDIIDVVIKRILPQYASPTTKAPPSEQAYQDDVTMIIEALKLDSSETKKKRLRETLAQGCWILAENAASNQEALKKPNEVYFRSPELELYFGGNAYAWFLSKKLHVNTSLLADLGVAKEVRVTYRRHDRTRNVSIPIKGNWYARGLKGFDPDTEVDSFSHALKNCSVDKARFIWSNILLPHKHLLRGIVEKATRSDYVPSNKVEQLSKAGQTATAFPWMPTTKGEFCKLSDLCLEDLPEGFERDEELAKALGMKLPPTGETIRQLAEAVGVEIEALDYLKNNREGFQEFR